MMFKILSTYFVLCLIFTISFSTDYLHESLIQNENVTIVSDPDATSFKLSDFLIYPSNANFKNCILPFISSSENLLKIYFHFQKLDPKVNLEKFLPYSRLEVTVFVRLQRSYIAYIFENQFNPIFISEQPYTTINCIYIDEHIHENSIFVLFSSNTIVLLEPYILPKNKLVFAAYDASDNMVFVALKNSQENLTPISHGKIKPNDEIFPYCLNIILKAHNLNLLYKIYFKVFDSYRKYIQSSQKMIWDFGTLSKTYMSTLMNQIDVGGVFDQITDCFVNSVPICLKFVLCIPCLVYAWLWPIVPMIGFFIREFLAYHIQMFPFHILSIPFELYLCKHNVYILGDLTTNFFNFWLFPYSFYFIFRLFFARFELNRRVDDTKSHLYEIEPNKTMFAVPYLIEEKNNILYCPLQNIFFYLFLTLVCGFVFSIPFLNLFMIHEISNE